HYEDARDLHGLRQPREPHAAPGEQLRPRAARSAGHLRSAVPSLFRSDARARRGNQGRQRGCREVAMTLQELAPVLRQALLALGVLFVIVDVKVGAQILSWWRKRRHAIVTWPAPKPPFYAINLAIGVMLGILLFVTTVVVPRPAASVFGVMMMFLYYGYLLPLSTRIRRGLYRDGIWTDSGYMPYVDI